MKRYASSIQRRYSRDRNPARPFSSRSSWNSSGWPSSMGALSSALVLIQFTLLKTSKRSGIESLSDRKMHAWKVQMQCDFKFELCSETSFVYKWRSIKLKSIWFILIGNFMTYSHSRIREDPRKNYSQKTLIAKKNLFNLHAASIKNQSFLAAVYRIYQMRFANDISFKNSRIKFYS